ncbi:dihydrolipoyl dehydrogenase family protein [Nesterenkonia natronophila]|uniref:FAD-dependent oxidoreductase n=1 Tax=Nesterenkonia natronophila TaxID=2174932 RepID=A0A3A4F2C3_9MICC|nr:FAD-dependent oxidoreductase [Nesterenkonia natronophila]RJN31988.1 FAD-dependent oxidoreductase [Nesterenkonia natronophila]
MEEHIDLLVIGGGTAGIVGAKTAVRLGARTVLVEQARTGGDCLWTGCVPSKTLLSAAAQAAAARQRTGAEPNYDAVRARIHETIRAIEPEDSPEALEAFGVTALHGSARFIAPGEATVDGKLIRFRQALIATGSTPAIPPIQGLENAPFVTSETIWDLPSLPPRLLVLGGGPMACELGQAFARLGSEVTLLARSGLLPKEDDDASSLVRSSLERDGVTVLHEEAARVSTADGTTAVSTGTGESVETDVVLIAAGRAPRVGNLGLDTVGVDCDDAGQVLVDGSMRTSNRSIWAAGDVTQYPKFTHLAGVYSSTAASNAVLGLRRTVSRDAPRVTFTSPEVAAVGKTDASGPGETTSTVTLQDTDRAVTEGTKEGFVRLVIGKRGRILGGTIVGPRAGESLGELAVAVSQKMTTRQLAGVTHAYPTYNDALWNAAIAHARSGLDSRLVQRATGALSSLVRRRQERRRRHGST